MNRLVIAKERECGWLTALFCQR